MSKSKNINLFEADIYKLSIGDVIYHNSKKQIVESIRKGGNGMIETITTDSHHLCGFNIFTNNKNKKLN